MNRILTTALLALAAGTQAALPTSGLPSGNTDIAIHISNETLDQTMVGKALTSSFQGQVDANNVVIALKRELGFGLDEDFRDVTLVAKGGDRKSLVALLRGKLDKARIEAFAAKNNVASHPVRGLKAWDLRALGQAISKAAGNTETASAASDDSSRIVIIDGNTAVIADESNIERAVVAATSGSPWRHEGLTRAAGSVQNGWLLASADVAAIEEAEAARRKVPEDASPEAKAALAKRSGAKVVTLALGENTTDLTLRVHADFVDEAAAKKNVAQIKGMLGFGAMLTMPAETDSAEQAANKATGADLLRRINVTQSGSTADASLDYPIQKLAQAIVRAAEIAREKKAAKGK